MLVSFIATVVLVSIVLANIIIAIAYFFAARRRHRREEAWRREIAHHDTHPKLKNHYPD